MTREFRVEFTRKADIALIASRFVRYRLYSWIQRGIHSSPNEFTYNILTLASKKHQEKLFEYFHLKSTSPNFFYSWKKKFRSYKPQIHIKKIRISKFYIFYARLIRPNDFWPSAREPGLMT